MRRRRVLGGSVAVLAALLIVGAVYQRLADAADLRAHPPPGALVDMGGYRLHLYCVGNGSPTVVLVPGGGDPWATWDPVQRGLEPHTRVCSYDRPGLGYSDFIPRGSLDVDQQVTLLHELLVRAGEGPPYVVAGHSVGGIIARRFAERYLSETSGLVLVESSVEGQFSELPAAVGASSQSGRLSQLACEVVQPFGLIWLLGVGEARARDFPSLSSEARAAIAASSDKSGGCAALRQDGVMADEAVSESSASLRPLGDLPLVVITRGLATGDANSDDGSSQDQAALSQQTQTIWQGIQAGLVKLSTRSTWLHATGGDHYVQTTEPELVTTAILGLVGGS